MNTLNPRKVIALVTAVSLAFLQIVPVGYAANEPVDQALGMGVSATVPADNVKQNEAPVVKTDATSLDFVGTNKTLSSSASTSSATEIPANVRDLFTELKGDLGSGFSAYFLSQSTPGSYLIKVVNKLGSSKLTKGQLQGMTITVDDTATVTGIVGVYKETGSVDGMLLYEGMSQVTPDALAFMALGRVTANDLSARTMSFEKDGYTYQLSKPGTDPVAVNPVKPSEVSTFTSTLEGGLDGRTVTDEWIKGTHPPQYKVTVSGCPQVGCADLAGAFASMEFVLDAEGKLNVDELHVSYNSVTVDDAKLLYAVMPQGVNDGGLGALLALAGVVVESVADGVILFKLAGVDYKCYWEGEKAVLENLTEQRETLRQALLTRVGQDMDLTQAEVVRLTQESEAARIAVEAEIVAFLAELETGKTTLGDLRIYFQDILAKGGLPSELRAEVEAYMADSGKFLTDLEGENGLAAKYANWMRFLAYGGLVSALRQEEMYLAALTDYRDNVAAAATLEALKGLEADYPVKGEAIVEPPLEVVDPRLTIAGWIKDGDGLKDRIPKIPAEVTQFVSDVAAALGGSGFIVGEPELQAGGSYKVTITNMAETLRPGECSSLSFVLDAGGMLQSGSVEVFYQGVSDLDLVFLSKAVEEYLKVVPHPLEATLNKEALALSVLCQLMVVRIDGEAICFTKGEKGYRAYTKDEIVYLEDVTNVLPLIDQLASVLGPDFKMELTSQPNPVTMITAEYKGTEALAQGALSKLYVRVDGVTGDIVWVDSMYEGFDVENLGELSDMLYEGLQSSFENVWLMMGKVTLVEFTADPKILFDYEGTRYQIYLKDDVLTCEPVVAVIPVEVQILSSEWDGTALHLSISVAGGAPQDVVVHPSLGDNEAMEVVVTGADGLPLAITLPPFTWYEPESQEAQEVTDDFIEVTPGAKISDIIAAIQTDPRLAPLYNISQGVSVDGVTRYVIARNDPELLQLGVLERMVLDADDATGLITSSMTYHHDNELLTDRELATILAQLEGDISFEENYTVEEMDLGGGVTRVTITHNHPETLHLGYVSKLVYDLHVANGSKTNGTVYYPWYGEGDPGEFASAYQQAMGGAPVRVSLNALYGAEWENNLAPDANVTIIEKTVTVFHGIRRERNPLTGQERMVPYVIQTFPGSFAELKAHFAGVCVVDRSAGCPAKLGRFLAMLDDLFARGILTEETTRQAVHEGNGGAVPHLFARPEDQAILDQKVSQMSALFATRVVETLHRTTELQSRREITCQNLRDKLDAAGISFELTNVPSTEHPNAVRVDIAGRSWDELASFTFEVGEDGVLSMSDADTGTLTRGEAVDIGLIYEVLKRSLSGYASVDVLTAMIQRSIVRSEYESGVFFIVQEGGGYMEFKCWRNPDGGMQIRHAIDQSAVYDLVEALGGDAWADFILPVGDTVTIHFPTSGETVPSYLLGLTVEMSYWGQGVSSVSGGTLADPMLLFQGLKSITGGSDLQVLAIMGAMARSGLIKEGTGEVYFAVNGGYWRAYRDEMDTVLVESPLPGIDIGIILEWLKVVADVETDSEALTALQQASIDYINLWGAWLIRYGNEGLKVAPYAQEHLVYEKIDLQSITQDGIIFLSALSFVSNDPQFSVSYLFEGQEKTATFDLQPGANEGLAIIERNGAEAEIARYELPPIHYLYVGREDYPDEGGLPGGGGTSDADIGVKIGDQNVVANEDGTYSLKVAYTLDGMAGEAIFALHEGYNSDLALTDGTAYYKLSDVYIEPGTFPWADEKKQETTTWDELVPILHTISQDARYRVDTSSERVVTITVEGNLSEGDLQSVSIVMDCGSIDSYEYVKGCTETRSDDTVADIRFEYWGYPPDVYGGSLYRQLLELARNSKVKIMSEFYYDGVLIGVDEGWEGDPWGEQRIGDWQRDDDLFDYVRVPESKEWKGEVQSFKERDFIKYDHLQYLDIPFWRRDSSSAESEAFFGGNFWEKYEKSWDTFEYYVEDGVTHVKRHHFEQQWAARQLVGYVYSDHRGDMEKIPERDAIVGLLYDTTVIVTETVYTDAIVPRFKAGDPHSEMSAYDMAMEYLASAEAMVAACKSSNEFCESLVGTVASDYLYKAIALIGGAAVINAREGWACRKELKRIENDTVTEIDRDVFLEMLESKKNGEHYFLPSREATAVNIGWHQAKLYNPELEAEIADVKARIDSLHIWFDRDELNLLWERYWALTSQRQYDERTRFVIAYHTTLHEDWDFGFDEDWNQWVQLVEVDRSWLPPIPEYACDSLIYWVDKMGFLMKDRTTASYQGIGPVDAPLLYDALRSLFPDENAFDLMAQGIFVLETDGAMILFEKNGVQYKCYRDGSGNIQIDVLGTVLSQKVQDIVTVLESTGTVTWTPIDDEPGVYEIVASGAGLPAHLANLTLRVNRAGKILSMQSDGMTDPMLLLEGVRKIRLLDSSVSAVTDLEALSLMLQAGNVTQGTQEVFFNAMPSFGGFWDYWRAYRDASGSVQLDAASPAWLNAWRAEFDAKLPAGWAPYTTYFTGGTYYLTLGRPEGAVDGGLTYMSVNVTSTGVQPVSFGTADRAYFDGEAQLLFDGVKKLGGVVTDVDAIVAMTQVRYLGVNDATVYFAIDNQFAVLDYDPQGSVRIEEQSIPEGWTASGAVTLCGDRNLCEVLLSPEEISTENAGELRWLDLQGGGYVGEVVGSAAGGSSSGSAGGGELSWCNMDGREGFLCGVVSSSSGGSSSNSGQLVWCDDPGRGEGYFCEVVAGPVNNNSREGLMEPLTMCQWGMYEEYCRAVSGGPRGPTAPSVQSPLTRCGSGETEGFCLVEERVVLSSSGSSSGGGGLTWCSVGGEEGWLCEVLSGPGSSAGGWGSTGTVPVGGLSWCDGAYAGHACEKLSGPVGGLTDVTLPTITVRPVDASDLEQKVVYMDLPWVAYPGGLMHSDLTVKYSRVSNEVLSIGYRCVEDGSCSPSASYVAGLELLFAGVKALTGTKGFDALLSMFVVESVTPVSEDELHFTKDGTTYKASWNDEGEVLLAPVEEGIPASVQAIADFLQAVGSVAISGVDTQGSYEVSVSGSLPAHLANLKLRVDSTGKILSMQTKGMVDPMLLLEGVRSLRRLDYSVSEVTDLEALSLMFQASNVTEGTNEVFFNAMPSFGGFWDYWRAYRDDAGMVHLESASPAWLTAWWTEFGTKNWGSWTVGMNYFTGGVNYVTLGGGTAETGLSYLAFNVSQGMTQLVGFGTQQSAYYDYVPGLLFQGMKKMTGVVTDVDALFALTQLSNVTVDQNSVIFFTTADGKEWKTYRDGNNVVHLERVNAPAPEISILSEIPSTVYDPTLTVSYTVTNGSVTGPVQTVDFTLIPNTLNDWMEIIGTDEEGNSVLPAYKLPSVYYSALDPEDPNNPGNSGNPATPETQFKLLSVDQISDFELLFSFTVTGKEEVQTCVRTVYSGVNAGIVLSGVDGAGKDVTYALPDIYVGPEGVDFDNQGSGDGTTGDGTVDSGSGAGDGDASASPAVVGSEFAPDESDDAYTTGTRPVPPMIDGILQLFLEDPEFAEKYVLTEESFQYFKKYTITRRGAVENGELEKAVFEVIPGDTIRKSTFSYRGYADDNGELFSALFARRGLKYPDWNVSSELPPPQILYYKTQYFLTVQNAGCVAAEAAGRHAGGCPIFKYQIYGDIWDWGEVSYRKCVSTAIPPHASGPCEWRDVSEKVRVVKYRLADLIAQGLVEVRVTPVYKPIVMNAGGNPAWIQQLEEIGAISKEYAKNVFQRMSSSIRVAVQEGELARYVLKGIVSDHFVFPRELAVLRPADADHEKPYIVFSALPSGYNATTQSQAKDTLVTLTPTEPASVGGLSQMSYAKTAAGYFVHGSLSLSYRGIESLDAKLLYAALSGLVPQADILTTLPLITVLSVDERGAIYFEKDGVTYKAYRAANGKITVEENAKLIEELILKLQNLVSPALEVDVEKITYPNAIGGVAYQLTLGGASATGYLSGLKIIVGVDGVWLGMESPTLVDPMLLFRGVKSATGVSSDSEALIRMLQAGDVTEGTNEVFFDIEGTAGSMWTYWRAYRDGVGNVQAEMATPTWLGAWQTEFGSKNWGSWQVYTNYYNHGTFYVAMGASSVLDGGLSLMEFNVTQSGIQPIRVGTPQGSLNFNYDERSVAVLLFEGLRGLESVETDIDALHLLTQISSVRADETGAIFFTLGGQDYKCSRDRDGVVQVERTVMLTPVVTGPSLETEVDDSPTFTLTGTKPANTSIWVSFDGGLNYAELVPLNASSDWSALVPLVYGGNNFLVQARNVLGEQSPAVAVPLISRVLVTTAPAQFHQFMYQVAIAGFSVSYFGGSIKITKRGDLSTLPDGEFRSATIPTNPLSGLDTAFPVTVSAGISDTVMNQLIAAGYASADGTLSQKFLDLNSAQGMTPIIRRYVESGKWHVLDVTQSVYDYIVSNRGIQPVFDFGQGSPAANAIYRAECVAHGVSLTNILDAKMFLGFIGGVIVNQADRVMSFDGVTHDFGFSSGINVSTDPALLPQKTAIISAMTHLGMFRVGDVFFLKENVLWEDVSEDLRSYLGETVFAAVEPLLKPHFFRLITETIDVKQPVSSDDLAQAQGILGGSVTAGYNRTASEGMLKTGGYVENYYDSNGKLLGQHVWGPIRGDEWFKVGANGQLVLYLHVPRSPVSAALLAQAKVILGSTVVTGFYLEVPEGMRVEGGAENYYDKDGILVGQHQWDPVRNIDQWLNARGVVMSPSGLGVGSIVEWGRPIISSMAIIAIKKIEITAIKKIGPTTSGTGHIEFNPLSVTENGACLDLIDGNPGQDKDPNCNHWMWVWD